MNSFFINPSSLTGGSEWKEHCLQHVKDLLEKETDLHRHHHGISETDTICEGSALGGLLQVIFLFAVYAKILLYVRLDGTRFLLFLISNFCVKQSIYRHPIK